MQGTPDSRIRKIFARGIRNLGSFACGILGLGIRNPSFTEKDLESSNCNPESTAWNSEF